MRKRVITAARKRIACLLSALLLLTLVPNFTPGFSAKAAEIEKTDLFSINTPIAIEGQSSREYPQIRIPGIVVTGTGTVLGYCEARTQTSDWAVMDILMRRSTDGGETWSDAVLLADGISTDQTYNNPVMIAEPGSDTVHLLFCREYHQVFYQKSRDGGLTWTTPVNITAAMKESAYNWKVVATGPGHGIALENGRLLVPVWMANGADDRSHNNTAVTTLYSDDSGMNWTVGELVSYHEMPLPESGTILSNPNETQLVQLSDGSVMVNSKAGYFSSEDPTLKRGRAVSVSPDGIQAWTTPAIDPALVDSGCFAGLVRYPGINEETGTDGILFVNPNSSVSREHLTLRLSTDNGKTWPHSKLIQLGGSAYADIAVGPDRTIYILYEKGPYNHLTLARFTLDWLLEPPPETQLMNIELTEGVLSPRFISENHTYSAAIAEDIQSIHITPHAFVNANSRITVDGTAVSSGETISLEMQGDTKVIVVAVSSPDQTKTQEYLIHLKKQKRAAAFQFEVQPDGGLFDSVSHQKKDALFTGNVSYTEALAGNGLLFQTSGTAPEKFGLVDVADMDALRFGTGDFAVSFWIQPESVTGQKLIFWYSNNTSETSQWWLRIQDGKIAFSTGYKGPDEPKASETNADSGSHKIQPRVWSHIVAQRKEGVMSIYINGEKCAEKGSTPWNVSSGESCTLYIGRAKGDNIRPFEGILDELQFFNYGLSTEAILTLAEPPKLEEEADPKPEQKIHKKYINGYKDGTFQPEKHITRAEAAQIFYELLTDSEKETVTPRTFQDVKQNWYKDAVETLGGMEILRGYTDGTFRPGQKITRAELTALAVRFSKTTTAKEPHSTFPDVKAGNWYYEEVGTAAEKGWITGYKDGSFRPGQNITRAETVTITTRILDRRPDKAYIDENIAKLTVFSDIAAAGKNYWAYYTIIEAANTYTYTADADGSKIWMSNQ